MIRTRLWGALLFLTLSLTLGVATPRLHANEIDGVDAVRGHREKRERRPAVRKRARRHAVDLDVHVLGQSVVRKAAHGEVGRRGLAAVVRACTEGR